MSYPEFKNKVAFITGASSGIGRATAIAFAKEGANVVIADVLDDAGVGLANELQSQGHNALFTKCDVSRESDIQQSLQQTIKKYGRLDYAFNNAGIEGQPSSTADCTNENWEKTININLRGVWWCMKHQILLMMKNGGGAITNCSSIAGLVGFEGIPAYVASKHGVIGLTKTAALEYAKYNIRVNAICPGVIKTPMIDRFTHGEAQAMRTLVEGEPLGRMGDPQEVATAALWLSSAQSSFVTGHPLVVDGGWVAR
jgi:NAD(P)-dependent dehydrogenase (short-subunit alcohol dehydrogenase family)